MVNLKCLFLYGNQLDVIRSDLLAGLGNMRQLRIYGNQIHTVQANSFKDLVLLSDLQLQDNLLTTLLDTTFDLNNHPSSLNNFHIKNNPLVCDERLSWIMAADGTWLTVQSPELIQCTGPPSLASLTWDNLSPDNLTQASLCEY